MRHPGNNTPSSRSRETWHDYAKKTWQIFRNGPKRTGDIEIAQQRILNKSQRARKGPVRQFNKRRKTIQKQKEKFSKREKTHKRPEPILRLKSTMPTLENSLGTFQSWLEQAEERINKLKGR